MKGMTVRDLTELCFHLIKEGCADKRILITQDDEGNGFHTLWGDCETDVGTIRRVKECTPFHDNDDPEDVILLG